MEDKEYFQKVLEKILEEPRISHRYRGALESVHRIQLHPNIKEESPEFKIFLEQEGYKIYLTIEGKKFEKREHFPQELTEIIMSSKDYQEGRITPETLTKNFTKYITVPLGEYLASRDIPSLEKYILKKE